MTLDWWAEHWLAGLLLLAYTGLLLHHANLGRRRAKGVAGYTSGRRLSRKQVKVLPERGMPVMMRFRFMASLSEASFRPC